jgi:diguanylate cyclase (GGDEF)-like protein
MSGSAAGTLEASTVAATTRSSYVLVADGDIMRSAWLVGTLAPVRIGALVARDGVEATEILERFGPPAVLVIALSVRRRAPVAVMKTLRRMAGPERTGIIALASVNDLGLLTPTVRRDLAISAVLPHAVSAGAFRAAVERALTETADARAASSQRHAPDSTDADVVGEILRDVTGRAARLAKASGSVAYVELGGVSRFRAYVDWISDRSDRSSPFAVPYVLEWIERTGNALIVPDLEAQPIFRRRSETLPDVVRGLIAVPLAGAKRPVVGALCVFDVKPLMITSEQLEGLKHLGIDAGALLERHLPETLSAAARAHDTRANGFAAVDRDSVTGLLTADSGRVAIYEQAARASEHRHPISLILIAPDRLNAAGIDRESGDRALRAFSQLLKVMLRASDVAVRWGPAEFLIVLPEVGVATARSVAERVRTATQRTPTPEKPLVTISGGVTEVPPGSSPESGVERVREHLEKARKGGGNRIY